MGLGPFLLLGSKQPSQTGRPCRPASATPNDTNQPLLTAFLEAAMRFPSSQDRNKVSPRGWGHSCRWGANGVTNGLPSARPASATPNDTNQPLSTAFLEAVMRFASPQDPNKVNPQSWGHSCCQGANGRHKRVAHAWPASGTPSDTNRPLPTAFLEAVMRFASPQDRNKASPWGWGHSCCWGANHRHKRVAHAGQHQRHQVTPTDPFRLHFWK